MLPSGGTPTGTFGGQSFQLPMGNTSAEYPGMVDALLQAGLSGDEIESLIGSPSGGIDFGGLEQALTGGSGAGGAGTAIPGTSSLVPGGTDWGGALGGAAGALGGLYNIYGGAQGGNAQQAVGGGLQGAGGLAQILMSSPQLDRKSVV